MTGTYPMMKKHKQKVLSMHTPAASLDEDFAETIAIYVSIKPTEWKELLSKAGENGASLIVRKLNMARQYMSETWNINLDELRNVTQRRLSDVTDGTLDLSPVATLDETD